MDWVTAMKRTRQIIVFKFSGEGSNVTEAEVEIGPSFGSQPHDGSS
jgi:hypothetical protein